MKHIQVGIGIFVLGFVLLMLFASAFGSDSSTSIIFAILYLSAIIGGSTSLILEELKDRDK